MFEKSPLVRWICCSGLLLGLGFAGIAPVWGEVPGPVVPGPYYSVDMGGKDDKIQPIPWPVVNELWQKGETAWLIHVESGQAFRVRRLFGSCHADVEPLTFRDTRVMSKVYGGKWSWRRQAVIVKLGHLYIAGSINGMPHGRESISDNGFPGHFCLHFLGSRIHRSRRIDPEHQEMVRRVTGLRLRGIKKREKPQNVEVKPVLVEFGEVGLNGYIS
jgi:hypothetical protein